MKKENSLEVIKASLLNHRNRKIWVLGLYFTGMAKGGILRKVVITHVVALYCAQ